MRAQSTMIDVRAHMGLVLRSVVHLIDGSWGEDRRCTGLVALRHVHVSWLRKRAIHGGHVKRSRAISIDVWRVRLPLGLHYIVELVLERTKQESDQCSSTWLVVMLSTYY